MADRNWEELTLMERLTAVCVDVNRDEVFSRFGPTMMVGEVHVLDVPTITMTAATDGCDEYYFAPFIEGEDRETLRYIRLHETVHKLLRHCTPMYRQYVEKYPDLSNMAMDYVDNWLLEELDAGRGFIKRPTKVAPLIDPQYADMSWLDVLEKLVKNQPPPPPTQPGQPGGTPKPGGQPGGGTPRPGGTLDNHLPGKRTHEQEVELGKIIEDAVVQGKIIAAKLQAQKGAGNGDGGLGLGVHLVQSRTDWRPALTQFLESVIPGDEYSRYNPRNTRLSGVLDVVFPTRFDEGMGELVIACDTSGSMYGVLGNVFGNIVQILKQVPPAKVHLIWWDTKVCGVQTFEAGDYDRLKDAMKPKGGGGTMPSCVTEYLTQHKEIDAAAIVWLTDGDFYEAPHLMPKVPQIWGVIGNHKFKAPRGKIVRIPAL